MADITANNGVFKSDLLKTFKQLKESRAESVAEDVETTYKRKIEDLCHAIRRFDRDREDIMLDLAPSTGVSNAVVPSDFNADAFLDKDLKIGVDRRNAVIQLEILVERYEHLFGEYPDKSLILKAMPSWKSTVNTEQVEG